MSELVTLVDDAGHPIGTAEKAGIHTASTPLHLAFSCHVRDRAGNLLMTRRSLGKAAWPGVWTNSVCGHPLPDEDFESAIARRARDELGISVRDIEPLLPDFRYDATDSSGIRENEVCPVFTAVTDDVPVPSADEVVEFAWSPQADVEAAVGAAPWAFSPWFVWQLDDLAGRERRRVGR